MLSFSVYIKGKPTERIDLAGAYVVGTDDVPLRAEITSEPGLIVCKKRAAGPAGLALLWNVEGVGRILVETIRVQERDQPYVLQVELARGRLVRIGNKLEDWGLHDYPPAAEWLSRLDESRELLITALQADELAEAAALGDRSLAVAVAASEGLAGLHAELFASRRKQSPGFSRYVFGGGVARDAPTEDTVKPLTSALDFVSLPVSWRELEPAEQTLEWTLADAWIEDLSARHMRIHAGPLLSFREGGVPDWLYIWEHDFGTIRDLAFEHIRRVINRYGQHVEHWTVVSGLHADNCFSFNFEQIMELTRMACALTKQLAPQGTAIVELVAPWGEYYARNQRTIPPMLYADMAVQSGVPFDAFGVRLAFGPAADGLFVRDMFQVSTMLDQFSKLGKPLHITAVQVPSATTPMEVTSADGATMSLKADGGVWHEPWSELTQAEWVRWFVNIALSKPFVESVTWHGLTDGVGRSVPHGGLLRADGAPKAAFAQWCELRTQFVGRGERAGAESDVD